MNLNKYTWLFLSVLLFGCGSTADLLNCDMGRRQAERDADKYKKLYYECVNTRKVNEQP